MFYRLIKSTRLRASRGFFYSEAQPALCAVVLLFLLGIILGTFVGGFFSADAYPISGVLSPEGLLSLSLSDSAYKALFFICLALLFSTSYLGVFLIPALALVRAYTFSCCVASLYVSYGSRGLVCAAAALGVPAFLSIPAFILCACAGLEASRRLCALRFGAPTSKNARVAEFGHAVFVLSSCAAVIFYDYFILPILISQI